jgi:membrane protein
MNHATNDNANREGKAGYLLYAVSAPRNLQWFLRLPSAALPVFEARDTMETPMLHPQDIWTILRAAAVGFFDDNALSRSAAIAFYAATSLAPILLIVIAVVGLVVGDDVAHSAVSSQLSDVLGEQGNVLFRAIVEGAADQSSGIFAASVAIITLLITASGVFGEMQSSLNQIWRVTPASTNLSTLVRARAASLGLVGALGFLLLASLLVSAALSGLADFIDAHLPFGSWILSVINVVISLTLISLLFGAIYKVLPDRSLAWRDVRFGAITTAILFTVGKTLVGWYLGTSAVASSYGAAGSLIVLLLWVYYSSAIFLFGAEVTRAYAGTFGTEQDAGDGPAAEPRSPN